MSAGAGLRRARRARPIQSLRGKSALPWPQWDGPRNQDSDSISIINSGLRAKISRKSLPAGLSELSQPELPIWHTRIRRSPPNLTRDGGGGGGGAWRLSPSFKRCGDRPPLGIHELHGDRPTLAIHESSRIYTNFIQIHGHSCQFVDRNGVGNDMGTDLLGVTKIKSHFTFVGR